MIQRILILIFCVAAGVSAQAQSVLLDLSAMKAPPEESPAEKSIFWIPLASFLAPGLGQGLDGKAGEAGLFAGYAGLGYGLLFDSNSKLYIYEHNTAWRVNYYRDLLDEQAVAGAMTLHAGFLSAYDTFHDRVAAYQAKGQYEFLPKDQSLETILRAPIQAEYLTRWTTFVPLLAALVGSYADIISDPKPAKLSWRGSDLATGTYIGYEAGTGEEAFFRGYLFPVLYQTWDHSWTANVTQALVFGYAHTQFTQPYFQILSGWYFGWLAERNGFDVREGAFLHAWWDFVLENTELLRDRSLNQDFHIRFPAVNFTF